MEPMFDQLRIPFTQTRRAKFCLENKPRPPRNIERTARQRFIHRRIGMAIARNALFIAQRLQHSLANGNARIFSGVVLVDMQIADCFDLQVNQRMARELLQHMVQKANARRDLVKPRAI